MEWPHVDLRDRDACCAFLLENLEADAEIDHASNVRLCKIIASNPPGVVVELHWINRPTRLGVALRATDREGSIAVERCLSTYLSLSALLSTFWPHATFRPAMKNEELADLIRPFHPGSCLRIDRRREAVRLMQPLECRPIGFEEQRSVKRGGESVNHVFPWVASLDPWNALLDVFAAYPAQLHLVVSLGRATGVGGERRRIAAVVARCEQFLSVSQHAAAVRDVCLARDLQLAECALRGSVRLYAFGPVDRALGTLLGTSISGGGFSCHESFVGSTLPLTADEAACAFRLPFPPSADSGGLPVRRFRIARAELPKPALDSVRAGVNRYRGAAIPIALDLEHRLRHMALFGMTGSGKSTLMKTLCLADVLAGRGCAFVDPHGSSIDFILERFPEERASDLVVIDLEDREHPVPLNLLAWRTLEERDLIIDEMFATITSMYDPSMTGPIYENNFRGMMKLLMGDRPDRPFTATVLEFPKCYLSKAFRQYLLKQTSDQEARDFLTEAERVSYGDCRLENLAVYITSKYNRFIHDTLLRRVFGHGAMKLEFDAILRDRKVVLIKLARGRFGGVVGDLLVSQIISRFRLAAMARGTAAHAPAYFIYVDEFGSLARNENFPSLLAEARKYRLGLVLATQYAAQLRGGRDHSDSLSAILGNVGTLACFRVGAEDAALLAPSFLPAFRPQDLMQFPNWYGCMRLHLNGHATGAFSFETELSATPGDQASAAKLVERSRRSWAVSAGECDSRAAARQRFIAELSAD